MRWHAVVVVAAMISSGHVFLAQDEPLPAFRTGGEAVMFDVRVTDAAGSPVTDLEPPDGRPRGPADRWPAQPDVRSNDDPEGRIFLFAVDESVGPDWASLPGYSTPDPRRGGPVVRHRR